MVPKIILISGKKFHGKDTFADFLIKDMKHLKMVDNTYIIPFAESLKSACREIFLLSNKQMFDPVAKEETDPRWGKTPRQIMQEMGTEVGRAIHKDVWVLNTLFKAKKILAEEPRTCILIPDCRFPNEIEIPREMFPELGNVMAIRVTRPNMPATPFDGHASETSLDNYKDFNFFVVNNGTVEDLAHVSREIVRSFTK